jgi:hypothetical protein|tara:strand:- start:406 stop:540 length:135 start_codon:yes stop_codon:yes gene_type:complete
MLPIALHENRRWEVEKGALLKRYFTQLRDQRQRHDHARKNTAHK